MMACIAACVASVGCYGAILTRASPDDGPSGDASADVTLPEGSDGDAAPDGTVPGSDGDAGPRDAGRDSTSPSADAT
jgi:hypothetical protein